MCQQIMLRKFTAVLETHWLKSSGRRILYVIKLARSNSSGQFVCLSVVFYA